MSEASLRASVLALSREVESIRGLRFVRPVQTRVDRAQDTRAHFETEGQTANERLDALLAVGLGLTRTELHRDHDAFARMMASEAQGYYDPHEAVLVLSDDDATRLQELGPRGTDARATVVHELVHALQHQHYRARVEVDEDAPAMDDRADTRLALLEGDATLVALEWAARQQGRRLLGTEDLEPRIARWLERAMVLTEHDVEPYLLDALELPYHAGVRAVAQMQARGGWDAVNRALADSALSSGALMHADREQSVWQSVSAQPVSDPALRVLTERTLGEIELRLLVSQVVRDERAGVIAGVWRGDRVTLQGTEGEGALVLRWVIACESPEGARGLVAALEPMVARWRRQGCPRMRGAREGLCPVSIVATEATVRVSRGE